MVCSGGDLESNGEAANALATNPVGSESGPTGGAGELRCSGAGLVDVGRTNAALTAVPDDTAVRRDCTAESSGAASKAERLWKGRVSSRIS